MKHGSAGTSPALARRDVTWTRSGCEHVSTVASTAVDLLPRRTGAAAVETRVLQRKVKLALRDGQTDLSCLQRTAEGIKGDAGTGWNWLSKGSRAAGILTGGASAAILALAAANIWNPGGWALATISIGGGLLSTLFTWLGGRAERKAEKKRNTARRETLASARQSVDDTFDDFTTKVAEAAAATGCSTMAAVLSPPLREAVAARLILQASVQAGREFEELERALPRREPQKILADAARAIERRLHPRNRKAGDLIWSGDDWITDPLGLVARKDSAEPVRASARPTLGERSFDALRDMFVPDRPKAGEGKAWLRSARGAISKLPDGERILEEIERLVALGRPRLQLLGDYNTGKTSFIKRLLMFDAASVDLGGGMVFAVAADPFQRVGNVAAPSRCDYREEYRKWDGMGVLACALQDLPGKLKSLRAASHQRFLCSRMDTRRKAAESRGTDVKFARDVAKENRERFALLKQQLDALMSSARASLNGAVEEELVTATRSRLDSLDAIDAFLVPRMNRAIGRWWDDQTALLQKLIGEADAQVETRTRSTGAAKARRPG